MKSVIAAKMATASPTLAAREPGNERGRAESRLASRSVSRRNKLMSADGVSAPKIKPSKLSRVNVTGERCDGRTIGGGVSFLDRPPGGRESSKDEKSGRERGGIPADSQYDTRIPAFGSPIRNEGKHRAGARGESK